ncbi:MAG: alpha/beta hydrolase [Bdellovibrionaceae bacterium]|nr:alpha/beta hydrolase [Pseudobdellovibrionaceae bacterium]
MNSQMKEILDQYSRFHAFPIEELDPPAARQLPELRDAALNVMNHHAAARLFGGVVERIGRIEHRLIPGPDENLMARLYYPEDSHGLLPCLLYFHGGGFVLANVNSYDSSCRAIARAAGCIVISVAYRQAPEHRYPAAREDAFAAYEWLLSNAPFLGVDPELIAVGGESAGGNLAALVCLLARERRLPQPVHQLLIYPVTDCDFETPSYLEHRNAKPLNRAMMRWFFNSYLNSVQDRFDPLAFPLKATSLADLASATVLLAEIDPLRSEGRAYAEKLKAHGVPVFQKTYPGVCHEFFGLGALVDEARTAVKDAAEQLRIAYGDALETGEMIRLGSGFPALRSVDV